jgi:regulator of replication initiation timing
MLNEIAGNNTKEVIMVLNETIRQQQAEIAQLKHINKNWQISENILLLELEKLQHRELTDEEITACIDESQPDIADMIRFARAILRKAQNG